MKETWISDMQRKLDGYEQPAPELAWDEIARAAGKRGVVVPMWSRRVAAAVVGLLMVGGAAYFWQREAEEPKGMVANNNIEVSHIEGRRPGKTTGRGATPATDGRKISPEGATDRSVTPSGFGLHSRHNRGFTPACGLLAPSGQGPQQLLSVENLGSINNEQAREAAPSSETSTPDAPASDVALSETSTQDVASSDASTPNIPPSGVSSVKAGTMDAAWLDALSDGKSDARRRGLLNRLMAKVYLSNTVASGDGLGLFDSNSDRDYAYSDPQPTDTPIWGGKNGEQATNDADPSPTGPYAPNAPIFAGPDAPYAPTNGLGVIGALTDIHHHQPLRFGLLLRYGLGERWGVESGLTYTRLSADVTWSLGGRAVGKADQTLNYIGIPVSFSYQLWQNRRLGVYASVGGLVEKMVNGKLREHGGATTSLTIHPLQVSAHGAVGAELRLVDWMSVYAEPGVGYYFDNGSQVETLYQQEPLNLNLNLGLRFSLK